MRSFTSTVTAALVVAFAASGCRSPIPSCNEETQTIDTRSLAYSSPRIELLENGAFRAGSETYASCTDFCATLSGVSNVVSCQPPAGVPRYDGGPPELGIVCEVELVDCARPVIVKRIR